MTGEPRRAGVGLVLEARGRGMLHPISVPWNYASARTHECFAQCGVDRHPPCAVPRPFSRPCPALCLPPARWGMLYGPGSY